MYQRHGKARELSKWQVATNLDKGEPLGPWA